MGRKDMDVLIKQIKRQGGDVTLGGSGHYKVRKDGRMVATLPATPSDSRGLLNARARLRKAGFDV